MYFVVIIAFALLLADGLPPRELNLIPLDILNPVAMQAATNWTLLAAAGSVVLVATLAAAINRSALRQADGTHDGLDRLQEWHSYGGVGVLTLLTGTLLFLMTCTPWTLLVRNVWLKGHWSLLADAILIAPFLSSVLIAWVLVYPTDRVIRTAAIAQRALDGAAPRPVWGLGTYLIYKLRHQVLIIAAPMVFVLIAKHQIDAHRAEILWATRIFWAPEALQGIAVALVLLVAPVFIRWFWATQRLEDGELRSRLERQCKRIRLKHREILIWDSQGLIVNAAVMGFVSPLRYVMLSDGLLETMNPRQIEAVFGHEAGHVRHYHLQYFVVFSILSMMIVGGLLELAVRALGVDPRAHEGALQLFAMAATLVVWGAGFGWISRSFERQADVFGVRAITPDIESCTPDCPIHGSGNPPSETEAMSSPALCLGAAHVFGGTLQRIADLNGIPRDAPSWRHGSINSRCRLIGTLADQPAALGRFDRKLWGMKAAMIALTVIGSAAAAYLYWPKELFSRGANRPMASYSAIVKRPPAADFSGRASNGR